MTTRDGWDTRPCARQRQRRRFVTIEAFSEWIRIIETFRPHMLCKRLRQRLKCDLPAWVITGDSGGPSDDFHRVTDEAIRSVMHPESHLDVRQGGHAVLRELFLNCAEEGPIGCPIVFGIPAKGPYTQGGAKAAPQLFILPKH